jgi:hypothetical protein
VPLALLIAEVKKLAEHGDGYSMRLKHLPDWPLRLDRTSRRSLARCFERELLAKAQQPDTRLIVGCTVRPAADGLGLAQTLAMMAVTPEWLPFEHLLERALLGELVRQRRRFLKPLPYEAGPSAMFASALLLNCGATPVPLHIRAPGIAGQSRHPGDGSAPAFESKAWLWRPGEAFAMPALPPAASRQKNRRRCLAAGG